METTNYQEPRFPIKWIAIPAAVLLLAVVPTLAFMGPSRGMLTGQVTFQGKPVTIGQVIAIAADGSVYSTGLDANGRYQIERITGGKVQVGVVSRDPAKAILRQQKIAQSSDRLPTDDRLAGRPGTVGKWIALPMQYEDPRLSALETTVKGTTEFAIELH